MIVWNNGKFTDESGAVFTASDRSLLGDGVFDTLLAIGPDLRYGREHMERLLRHGAIIGINSPYTPEELLGHVGRTLERNNIREGFHAVKTILTIGPGSRGMDLPAKQEPSCVITVGPVPAPDSLPPVSAVVARSTRRNEFSPLSRIKSLSYADNRLAREEARRAGADEAMLLNAAGRPVCAAAGNLFVQMEGEIYTPPLHDGVIDGVTRRLLLTSGAAKEKSLSESDLEKCEGAWVANSITGIRQVSSLNGRKMVVRKLSLYDAGRS